MLAAAVVLAAASGDEVSEFDDFEDTLARRQVLKQLTPHPALLPVLIMNSFRAVKS